MNLSPSLNEYTSVLTEVAGKACSFLVITLRKYFTAPAPAGNVHPEKVKNIRKLSEILKRYSFFIFLESNIVLSDGSMINTMQQRAYPRNIRSSIPVSVMITM